MKKYEYEEIKELIFILREKRYTYKKIAEDLTKKGYELNESKVNRICKKLYAEKEKQEPTAISKPELTEEDIIIYRLRKEGKSLQNISEELEKKGNKKSVQYIQSRLKFATVELSKDEKEKNDIKEKLKEIKRKQELEDKLLEAQIYNLRIEKKSDQEILNILKKQGIELTHNKLSKTLKKIFEEKHEADPLSRKYLSEEDLKIYELRKKEYTFSQISEELGKNGKKISYQAIQQRVNRIFKIKGEEDPVNLKRKGMSDWDEKIYFYKEQGYSNTDIAQMLSTDEVKYTSSQIQKSCQKTYKRIEENIPKITKNKLLTKTDEQFIELRKKGYSYNEIISMLEDDKYPKTVIGLYRKNKRIVEKTKEEPTQKLAEEKWKLNERIYDMRKSGLNCIEISKKLNEEGIEKNISSVRNICKKVKHGKQQLAKMIVNLINTKGATWEQVEKIAEYYKVDLEKTMNSLEER